MTADARIAQIVESLNDLAAQGGQRARPGVPDAVRELAGEAAFALAAMKAERDRAHEAGAVWVIAQVTLKLEARHNSYLSTYHNSMGPYQWHQREKARNRAEACRECVKDIAALPTVPEPQPKK